MLGSNPGQERLRQWLSLIRIYTFLANHIFYHTALQVSSLHVQQLLTFIHNVSYSGACVKLIHEKKPDVEKTRGTVPLTHSI
jgi:hypothetical protein